MEMFLWSWGVGTSISIDGKKIPTDHQSCQDMSPLTATSQKIFYVALRACVVSYVECNMHPSLLLARPRRKIVDLNDKRFPSQFYSTKEVAHSSTILITTMKFSLAVLSLAATASAFTAFNAPSRAIGASRVATSSVFAPVALRNGET